MGIGIKESSISEDLEYAYELRGYTLDDLIIKEYEYGYFPEGYFDNVVISYNLLTNELVSTPRAEEIHPITLSEQNIELQRINAELVLENLELYEAVANLYESMLGG